MRISDWSSDVCSSDLFEQTGAERAEMRVDHFCTRVRIEFRKAQLQIDADNATTPTEQTARQPAERRAGREQQGNRQPTQHPQQTDADPGRPPARMETKSEERRVEKECVSTCRSRWSQDT